jgi:hypothetical protein
LLQGERYATRIGHTDVEFYDYPTMQDGADFLLMSRQHSILNFALRRSLANIEANIEVSRSWCITAIDNEIMP